MNHIRIKGPFTGSTWPQSGGYTRIAEYLTKIGYKTEKFWRDYDDLIFLVSREDAFAFKLKYGNGQPKMWWG